MNEVLDKGPMKHGRWAFLLPLALASATSALAGELEDQGKALLTRFCAPCHASGETGASPHPGAPPFRSIGDRYDIDELTERMTEQLISTHPDMPDFKFSRQQANAVRSYLHSIQK
jgi:mono/diheme cytochrome c family protein